MSTLVRTTLFMSLLVAAGSAFAIGERLGPTPPGGSHAPTGGGIVSDPSFEAGTPNPVWSESSTNFGTPLCTVAACGSGTSAAPVRTGTWWAWFGGTPAAESGSVSQSITLPANSTLTLQFGFQAPVCVASATHFIEARINGNPVWRADGNDPLCNVTTGYTDMAVDISQYAGQTVTLSFDSTTDGGTTNFFIDDVDVVAAALPGVPVPAFSAWAAAAAALALGLFGFAALRRSH